MTAELLFVSVEPGEGHSRAVQCGMSEISCLLSKKVFPSPLINRMVGETGPGAVVTSRNMGGGACSGLAYIQGYV